MVPLLFSHYLCSFIFFELISSLVKSVVRAVLNFLMIAASTICFLYMLFLRFKLISFGKLLQENIVLFAKDNSCYKSF